jgi:hypothetical protein
MILGGGERARRTEVI